MKSFLKKFIAYGPETFSVTNQNLFHCIDLAWAYQTCTEFGFFQTSRKTNNTLDSRSTLDDSIRSCTDDFGST